MTLNPTAFHLLTPTQWWHILTSIGAYTFMALIEYLTSGEPGQTVEGEFAWPVGKMLPTKQD
jgi:hypothetical protein